MCHARPVASGRSLNPTLLGIILALLGMIAFGIVAIAIASFFTARRAQHLLDTTGLWFS